MKKKQYRYLQVKKELFDYIQGLPDQTRIPPSPYIPQTGL